jgi:pimeloyl-ACP methyl ester carboxylesterase
VMWLSGSGESERSAERVKESVDGQAVIVPKDLEVWGPDVPRNYGLQTETDAVARMAGTQGWDSFHLVGFSAGATVALAATLTLKTAVQTLAIIEPATIGDDAWSAQQAAWRAEMDAVFALPLDIQQEAFRRAVVHPDVKLEERPSPSTRVMLRGVLLWEKALRRTGLRSEDWGAISQPTLVVRCGRSHPRFDAMAVRLLEVMPNARTVEFSARSHLSSPHRDEPDRIARLLLELWSPACR